MIHFGPGDEFPAIGAKRVRKKTVVRMVQMSVRFACTSREGRDLEGQEGDWLAEDGHGGFYPVSADFFAANYEVVDTPPVVAHDIERGEYPLETRHDGE